MTPIYEVNIGRRVLLNTDMIQDCLLTCLLSLALKALEPKYIRVEPERTIQYRFHDDSWDRKRIKELKVNHKQH